MNQYEDEIRRGLAGEDLEGSELFAALRAAVRGEIDAKDIGRSKKLSESEELVADKLMEKVGRSPTVVRRDKPIGKYMQLQPGTIELLEEMARDFGYWHGGKGSISMLLDAIGAGKFTINKVD